MANSALNFTAQRRELVGFGVGHDGRQRLLPVVQVACGHDVTPVLGHHGANQLADSKKKQNKQHFQTSYCH